jgi:hypothetical protein
MIWRVRNPHALLLIYAVNTPAIDSVLVVLGKDEAVNRLSKVIQ